MDELLLADAPSLLACWELLEELGVALPEEPGRYVFSHMEHFMGLVLLCDVWC